MTDITIGSATLSVVGEPGKLTIGEWFFSATITSEDQLVTLAQTIGIEAKKAWPNLQYTVSTGDQNA